MRVVTRLRRDSKSDTVEHPLRRRMRKSDAFERAQSCTGIRRESPREAFCWVHPLVRDGRLRLQRDSATSRDLASVQDASTRVSIPYNHRHVFVHVAFSCTVDARQRVVTNCLHEQETDFSCASALGTCFHRAFFRQVAGRNLVPMTDRKFAAGLVATIPRGHVHFPTLGSCVMAGPACDRSRVRGDARQGRSISVKRCPAPPSNFRLSEPPANTISSRARSTERSCNTRHAARDRCPS